MPFDTDHLARSGLSAARLHALLELHHTSTLPRLSTLWSYYRNTMTTPGMGGAGVGLRQASAPSRPYRLAQERGLPARITGTGARDPLADDRSASARKEVVIENDIAWRVQTMVDFLFGRPVRIRSTAADPKLRERIERALEATWEASGGIGLLQDAALLGHVYGHVDLIVRAGALESPAGTRRTLNTPTELLEAARAVRIEAVEPRRGFSVLDPDDYRRTRAFILTWSREADASESSTDAPSRSRNGPSPRRIAPRWWLPDHPGQPDQADSAARTHIIEILSAGQRRVYTLTPQGPTLIDSGPALVTEGAQDELNAPPVVHIQNLSQPFRSDGLGEVEPLIPLQDELNTRLSDRAYRVTMSAFRMYFAKGFDPDSRLAIGPGSVLTSDNSDASITTIGADAPSPSEDAHVEQVREALDKASGVPPLATGVVRAKVGNLTSENALRLTLTGLISKTERKRITYGRGLARASELVLLALDRAGVLTTRPEDRAVRVEWPEILPRNEADALAAAKAKLELGVPRDRVLAELGYQRTEPEIV